MRSCASNYSYLEQTLRGDIEKSLAVVETILSNTRNPCLATPAQSHTYEDKFSLSVFLTSIALMAVCNALLQMGTGLKKDKDKGDDFDFQRLINVVVLKKKLAATLRFESIETWTLEKETTIDIESPEVVKEGGNLKSIFQSKVVTKVKQFHWKLNIRYRIYIYGGNDTSGRGEDSFTLRDETVSCEIITRGHKQSPERMLNYHEKNPSPLDVSLTWLLKQMKSTSTSCSLLTAAFDIDRSAESCRTPRNNAETMEAKRHLKSIADWCSQVSRYFTAKQKGVNALKLQNSAHSGSNQDGIHLASIGSHEVFNPVLPLFDTSTANGNGNGNAKRKRSDEGGVETTTTTTTTSPILPASDISSFLTEQCRTMEEQIEALKKQGDSSSSATDLMTFNEAIVTLLCKHLISIISIWNKSVDYIEDMLLTQLKDAIGKTVKSSDLDDFIRFHNQRIFHEDFAPEPFCYSIRRPGFHPEGVLSIEDVSDNNDKKSIHQAMTFSRKLETNHKLNPIFIPINAAASVEFRGDMYLHAWIMSKFNHQRNEFELVARTRQFSSFMLILGKMTGPDGFDPAHAIILQNKDEIMIPLLMEDLPSAKEFKDAIESLSPEQQRFAKAFRSMKLASSVFGVCVVQLKPQLEALLGLPDKSLTKEIRLTQDLLSLFIDYQIPSDLLTFDGDSNMDATSRLTVVKNHVKSVMDMIKSAKEDELKEEAMKANMMDEMRDQIMYNASFGASSCARKMSAAVPQMMQPKMASASSIGAVKRCRKSMSSDEDGCEDTDDDECEGNSRSLEAQSQEASKNNGGNFSKSDGISTLNSSIEFTNIPKKLNAAFEKFCADEVYGGVMRTTTFTTGQFWRKASQSNLLSSIETKACNVDDQKLERNRAFDLLDALSRSGSLPIACAELHIIVASTHSFDQSVVDTVIKKNVNPIDKIERSHLVVASLIHDVGLEKLLSSTHELKRIASHSPLLLDNSSTLDMLDNNE